MFTTFQRLQMVAAIGVLHGWDVRSDRLKTMAYLSLLGSGAGEALRSVGVKIGPKIAERALIKRLPGTLLIQLNKTVGFRLATKAGTKGAVNLVKLVPLAGGFVGAALNVASTQAIGRTADRLLKGGPETESEESDANAS